MYVARGQGTKIKGADGSFFITAGVKAKSLHWSVDGVQVQCRGLDRFPGYLLTRATSEDAGMPICKLCSAIMAKIPF